MRNVTDDSLLHRQPRRSWLWWWSSASPGCPTTSCTCGSSSARSPWTRAPSSSGWWLTAWPIATPPSTPSSTPSCRRISGTPTGRCSGARCPASVLWTTPGSSAANWRWRRPPTSAWPAKVLTLRSAKCSDAALDIQSTSCLGWSLPDSFCIYINTCKDKE